ncbi:protein CASC1-like [Dendronephthya gigantea]|uniref:protein CASC1-like n=1 Tax=Dendronephthya gigantea TaxID=151771 RepID=UPI00106BC5A6|nr:protein CASC1-like [Dendronephthya gigantea]
MPPKKGGKAKSPKLSKAEKEKLKKEEAERKAKEEEEARLQAEQEQREREEREQLEREEKERLAQQEREAHEAEVDELNGLLEDKYSQVKNTDERNRENAKWSRYMLCDGSPDPKITKEINTYINLWREDTDSRPVHKTIQECHDALKLIDELQYFLGDEPGLSEEDVEKHNESISHLQSLIRVKLDEATMHVLKCPDEYIDPDTQNIQFELTSRFITLNIWGNISRNPRLKSLTFEKKGITLDIPKPLSVGNVAVRCIFTNYDHFSEKSRLFYPRPKIVPPVVVQPQQPPVEINTEMVDNDSKENEIDENTLPAPEPSSAALTPKPPSSSRSRKKSSTTKRATSRLSASVSTSGRKSRNKSARKTPVPTASVTETDKTEETTEQDTDDQKTAEEDPATDPAKPGTAGDVEFDEDDDDDVVDLRAFSTADKVIYIELFELPPQPKTVKNWVIQHIAAPELVPIPYVFESKKSEDVTSSENDLPNNEDSEQTADDQTQAQKANAGNAPIHVTLRLPADVSYFEQPQVARWEASKNHWRLDGLSDIQFNDQTNMLRFKTNRFAPIAIFQDLYLNMPFQSWEIRPHGLNSCIFTIVAAAIDLEIEVKDSYCCVAHAEDSVQRLRHLRGKWMNPKDLIKRLKASGVNVFPAVDAEKYVSLNIKESTLEKNIYEQISLTASAFAYSWSRWNSDCGKEKIIVQATEQEADEPPLEEDWFIYMASNENSCKLKLSEFDETFSDDVAENTKLHADLYHMVMDGASQSAVSKVKGTSFQFFNCVSQLLNATKVLTYS